MFYRRCVYIAPIPRTLSQTLRMYSMSRAQGGGAVGGSLYASLSREMTRAGALVAPITAVTPQGSAGGSDASLQLVDPALILRSCRAGDVVALALMSIMLRIQALSVVVCLRELGCGFDH